LNGRVFRVKLNLIPDWKGELFMKKLSKWPVLVMSGVIVLMLALVGGIVLAQDATPEAEAPTQEDVPATDELRALPGFGHRYGFGGNSNWLTYLAEALGISVDELEDAQERAFEAAVADAVAAGDLTQEQADQILAAQALKSYIDRTAILATALGLTQDELEAALAGGQSITDLMVAQGIDTATLQANAQAAYEAAIEQAVSDGVITQAQADQFLSQGNFGFGLFGRGERGGHGGRYGGRGNRGFDFPFLPDAVPDSESNDTSLDA
jgi:hypothetical protein